MRNNHVNQRLARELAERHDSGFDARAREIRAENARRFALAQNSRAAKADYDELGTAHVRTIEPLQWLDDATRSVPAYEVIA